MVGGFVPHDFTAFGAECLGIAGEHVDFGAVVELDNLALDSLVLVGKFAVLDVFGVDFCESLGDGVEFLNPGFAIVDVFGCGGHVS